MDEPTFLKDLASRGCAESYYVDWEPLRVNREHSHPFTACALVLRGDFTLTTPTGSQCFRAGDAFELAAGTLHTETVGAKGVYLVAGRLSAR
jgi:quercetin dioxygenase-like cupin family protein